MYPAEIVLPMKGEMTDGGFEELLTAADVDAALGAATGTALVFINSVCGCAAGSARPGVLMAVQNSKVRPDHLLTTFAGFDTDAVKKCASIYCLIRRVHLVLRCLKMVNWFISLSDTISKVVPRP